MFKIGHSCDIHRLVEGRKLVLGLVQIPFEKGTLGHSDGDALAHAIAESIIGALGLGDLGTFFPDTNPKYEGLNSSYFIDEVVKMLKEKDFEIINIDCTIMIEKPLIKKYIPQMKALLAKHLKIEEEQINIKATRGEGLGFVGLGEGLEATAVVLINKK